MRHILRTTAVIVAALASSAAAQTYQPGLADLKIEDTGGQRDLVGFVWYPTDETTGLAEIHNSAVWAPVKAIRDAPPASGPFPLVVLSHGMYGNAMNQSWLASGLARRGFVVAAVNHPGTSTWARDPDDARQLWERPKDMSRVIDHLLDTTTPIAPVDPRRVFMAGHSLGGMTAIALAGGRYDPRGFARFCDGHPGELVCGILDRWQVAKTPEDQAQMAADLSDARIKGFAVFDLGGTQTFSTASLGRIGTPLLVFGAPRNIDGTGLDLEVESRALIAALPQTSVIYREPESLSHFDFLGECNPGGIEVLRAEEPDDVFVCIEGTAERRNEHQMVIDEVSGFFSGL